MIFLIHSTDNYKESTIAQASLPGVYGTAATTWQCFGDACADYYAILIGIQLYNKYRYGHYTQEQLEDMMTKEIDYHIRRGDFDDYVVN